MLKEKRTVVTQEETMENHETRVCNQKYVEKTRNYFIFFARSV